MMRALEAAQDVSQKCLCQVCIVRNSQVVLCLKAGKCRWEQAVGTRHVVECQGQGIAIWTSYMIMQGDALSLCSYKPSL